MNQIKKFSVVYQQPRDKSGYYSQQKAVFFDIRDAMLWERHVLENGCKNSEIVPVFD